MHSVSKSCAIVNILSSKFILLFINKRTSNLLSLFYKFTLYSYFGAILTSRYSFIQKSFGKVRCAIMSHFQKRDTFIPYNVPDITDAEINEEVDTLRSGWLAKGPKTVEFEKRFAEYVGAKYAVAVNSCTAALHVSLLSQDIGPGDEVITTPMTFASTASTIIHTGATPVFADIDYRTGCIDPKEIEKKITPRTRAIVPVHYSGEVCDLDSIYEIAKQHNLYVSEDAAHALWSR